MKIAKHGKWVLAVAAAVGIAGVVWLGLLNRRPPIQPTHIVLISIDTCRADHLGCYGHRPSYTPHLDALARQGVLFENVIAPAPITLPAHSTMLTGTIPPYHGVRYNGHYYLDDVHVTLAEILREHGFVTGAIVSAFVLDSRFGLDQGFADYDDEFDDAGSGRGDLQRKGGETTDHALAWLDQHHREKGFLFLHYYDPHMEYEAPGLWGQRFADRPYLGEIAYTDDCIGRVIQRLKDLGIYDSTLLVVTSDHGEMLGEHGEVTHTYYIYQSALRVPLIVKLPGGREPRRVASTVGVVDIGPTICGLLGIGMPAPVQGMDLSPGIRGDPPAGAGRAQYCESITPTKCNANPLFGLVTSRWKYIHTTRPELYDLHADAGELNNLIDRDPDRGIAMLNQLQQMLQLEPPRTESGRSVWDEETARRLGSLGYVRGASHENDFSIDPAGADPKDLIGLHNPAMQVYAFIHHKQYPQAREICEELVRQHPAFSEGHYLLASIAMGEANYAEAVEHLSRSVALNPDDPLAHQRLGRALWEEGDLERAAKSYRRALEILPTLPEAHGDLGTLLVQQGELDVGTTHLRQAVELKPESSVAHLFLAHALLKQNDLEQAAHHYGQAIEIDAASAEAHFGLAGIRWSQGRLSEAAEHFRQAIATSPDFLAAHQNLGNVLLVQGKPVEALEHFRRGLELGPDSVSLMNNVAWILATHPDPAVRQAEEAIRIARRAVDQTDRTNPSMLDTLSAAYANANQFEQAVATARSALELLSANGQEALRKGIRGRLELYERGQAYREPDRTGPAP